MVNAAIGALALLVGVAVVLMEFERREISRKRIPGMLVTGTAALSITLLQAPSLLGGSTTTKVISLVPFFACIAYCLPRASRELSRPVLLLLGAYVALVAVCLQRGALTLTGGGKTAVALAVTLITVAVFAVVVQASATQGAQRRERLIAIALAPALYVAINVALHLAGAVSSSTATTIGEPSEIASLFGLNQTRIVPPIANNVNSFGAVAGAAIAACLVLWRTGWLRRNTMLATVGICFYGIVLTDSRTALIAGLLIGLLLTPWMRVVRFAPLLLPVSPLIILYGPKLFGGLLNFVSRGSGDFATGNNRLYVWDPVWNFIRHAPIVETLVGWGANGQITSGASNHYAYLFRGVDDPYAITTHNLFLQTLLDTGWIGVAVLVALLVNALNSLRTDAKTPAAAVAAIILVMTFAGMTEALPTYIFPETIITMVLALGTAAVPVLARAGATSRARSQPDQLAA